MHEQQKETCNGKEDAIHDPERKARLQHGAVLVRVEMKRRRSANPIVIDGEGKVTVGGKVCAVRLGNVAEFVDTSNECADKCEVDERDEDGRITSRFTAEDGDDGPRCGKDGDDEEDEDGIWS